MKSLLILLLTLGIASPAPCVLAAPVTDVSSSHWAAGAVQRLTSENILVGSAEGKFEGNKPITRYELAVTLDRLVRYMETGQTPLRPKPAHASVKMPASADAKTQQALTHLADGGFIAPSSQLLQANKLVTAQELTDILSQIAIRLSDRSLPPTPH